MNRLIELRKNKLMVPKEVAKYLNISLELYLDYESYDKELSIEHLIKLALLYNTSVDYMLKHLIKELKNMKI